MALKMRPTAFARIVRNPGILGGEPTLRGTRIPVRSVVIEYRVSRGIGGVRQAFPHLDTATIREALAFYKAHRDEIDHLIAENESEADEE